MAYEYCEHERCPYKYPSLTGDMLFRLWNAAIMDDDTLADEMIRGMYHCMLAFDRERAEYVMDQTVRDAVQQQETHCGLCSRICKNFGAKQVAPTRI